MASPIARFDQVGKRYYLGKRRAFVRELLPDFLAKRFAERDTGDVLWALRDLSFEVMPGEALGIIGANGSGKTTALSLLAGITTPTTGAIYTDGTIGALIQLGAGFHPDLTGHENVYLNASILGLRKAQVDEIYEDIVRFSELEAFMETPVKRYSSGMFARLGFSVAAHINPDLLVVDEILATGDMSFQARCIRRMHDFVDQGRTVVFVSHNMNMVQGLCSRVMWIDRGRLMTIGSAVDVIAEYLDEMDRRMSNASFEEMRMQDLGTGDIRVERVVLKNEKGEERSEFRSGDSMTVELYYHAARRIQKPYFWIAISGKHGFLFGANMLLDDFRPEYLEGKGMLSCTFKSLPLLSQRYSIGVGIRANDGATHLIQPRHFASFRIIGKSKSLGLNAEVAESISRDTAPVLVPYEWRLPGGAIHPVNS